MGWGFLCLGGGCCAWLATGNMCLKHVDRARAGRSWWLLLCVSKGLVHMSACGHSCPGRDQSSPPCGLWEQAGKMPPFSSKPAHFLLALVQWVPWGAGRTGVSVLWVCSGHECQGCLGREFRDVQAMGVGTLMLWIQGCSGHGCGDAQALDAGMLTPWVPGMLRPWKQEYSCCSSSSLCHHCVRLPQLCHAQHGGTRCRPLGAAHRNRTHGLCMHHTNAAVRVPGTSLSSLPVPLCFFSFVFFVCIIPGEIPFSRAVLLHTPTP